jgi:Ca2+/H+ antiporter
MNFERVCELCRKAREIASKIGREFAALFLKANGVAVELAISCLVRKPLPRTA